jgi:hypothetical protein
MTHHAREDVKLDKIFKKGSKGALQPRAYEKAFFKMACSAAIWIGTERRSGWESGTAALA